MYGTSLQKSRCLRGPVSTFKRDPYVRKNVRDEVGACGAVCRIVVVCAESEVRCERKEEPEYWGGQRLPYQQRRRYSQ